MAETDPYQLKFRRRTWFPEARLDLAGIRSGRRGPGDRVHFLLQLKQLPVSAQRAALVAGGVVLQGYVGGITYIASMGLADLEVLLSIDLFRAAFPATASTPRPLPPVCSTRSRPATPIRRSPPRRRSR